jgi:hypothetical protein
VEKEVADPESAPTKRRGPNRAERRALYKAHKAAYAERKARDRKARERRERG